VPAGRDRPLCDHARRAVLRSWLSCSRTWRGGTVDPAEFRPSPGGAGVAWYALTASGGAIPAAGVSLSAPRPLLAETRTRHQELGDDAHHAHATRHVATCQFLCGQSQIATELLRTCSAPAPGTGGDWDLAESLEILTDQSRRRPPVGCHAPAAAAAIRGRTGTQPRRFDRARRTLPCARPRRPERLGPRMASRHPHVVDVLELSADAGAGSRRG
jgi:hypothetical protein